MKISLRPLTGSDADSRLFVDRQSELTLIQRSLGLDINCVVEGPRGGGRTSLLQQVPRLSGLRCAYVEGRAYGSARDLAGALRAALGDDRRLSPSWRPRDEGLWEALGMERDDRRPDLMDFEVQAIVDAANNLDQDHAKVDVVLLDDPDPRAAELLFGAFRDTLWAADVLWVVGITHEHRARLLAPPADAFFPTVVQLDELTVADAAELLVRRAQTGADGPHEARLMRMVQTIVHGVDARMPGNLVRLAIEVLKADSGQEVVAEINRQQMIASGLGRTEAMLLEELRSRPAHAGDEHLLSRMGLTRSRLVQAAGRLEEAGLLVSTRDGTRKVYRVVDAAGPR